MKSLNSIQNSKYYSTMKRFFIIFKILSFILIDIKISTGQTAKPAIKIENIKQTPDNTIKVNMLNNLSWTNRISNPSQANEYAQDAIAISKKIRYNSGLATSYMNKAFTSLYMKNYDEAAKYFIEAFKLTKKNLKSKKSKSDLAKIYEGIGLMNIANNDLAKSINYFKAALKLYNETGLRLNENICYRIIGSIYEELGDKTLANDYYYKELKNTIKSDISRETMTTYADFRTILNSSQLTQLNQTN